MKRHRKFVPYIRRLRQSDRGQGLRAAFRVELFKETGGYAVVQRGFPNLVMSVARTRDELVRSLIGALVKAKQRHKKRRRPAGCDVRAWANGLGRYARGEVK